MLITNEKNCFTTKKLVNNPVDYVNNYFFKKNISLHNILTKLTDFTHFLNVEGNLKGFQLNLC